MVYTVHLNDKIAKEFTMPSLDAGNRRIIHAAILTALCACLISSPAPSSETSPLSLKPVSLDGIIDQENDDTLAFTPDGKTVFFDRSSGPKKTIMVSHRVKQRWSTPQIASFSGQWFDQDPVVAPDGSYLMFNSDRPANPGAQPLIQNYFAAGPAPGSNIWRVDRHGDQWGEPVRLKNTINNDVFIDFASVTAAGTLYFMRWEAAEKSMHLWRSQNNRGVYSAPQFVTLGDPKNSIHDPAVAPDESFIVFDSGKVKGGLGRLCIAFREGDHWGKPIDLGDEINKDLPWGAHIDPDGHTIYVTDKTGIKRFSVTPWLIAHRH
jgi:WD40 repeat protein